jgi:hypothetical protein
VRIGAIYVPTRDSDLKPLPLCLGIRESSHCLARRLVLAHAELDGVVSFPLWPAPASDFKQTKRPDR